METLQFKLEVFEGPMDLLLHLIAKHKLDIMDIEISQLLDQYLNYIDQMRAVNLEVASEFLAMAARLVYIKTVQLLPRHEEAEELRRELTGELLELSAIKMVAEKLRALDQGFNRFVREPAELEVDPIYRGFHEPEELIAAYFQAVDKSLRKLPPKATEFAPILSHKVVSVTSRIFHILRSLYQTGHAELQKFFEGGERSEVVATFLAVLELVKSGRVTLSDDNSQVYMKKKTG